MSHMFTSLLCPLGIPAHASTQKKHLSGTPRDYSSDGLYQLVRTSLKKLGRQTGHEKAFTAEQLHHLLSKTPHAFRHTFSTLAVADGVPIDVAQAVLVHESPGTTGIYVKAKKKRMMEEAAKYFHR
jgi:integrase